jgi:hypothetical protein
MPPLFNFVDRASIERRVRALPLGATPAWGTFTSGQMLAHCGAALPMAVGDQPIGSGATPKILKSRGSHRRRAPPTAH